MNKHSFPTPNVHRTIVAFTLVEILVVLAVVIVLVALLLPVVTRARERAADLQTVSNLRTLGSLFHQYANENDGAFPWAQDPNKSGPTGAWKYELLRHAGLLRSRERMVLDTPGAPLRPKLIESGDYLATGFTANTSLLGEQARDYDWSRGGWSATRRTVLQRPSEKILVCTGGQGNWDNSAPTVFWMPGWWEVGAQPPDEAIPEKYQKTAYGSFGYYVNGGVGALMADGHVQVFRPGEILWKNLQPF